MKAAIYCRLSTDDEKSTDKSVERQEAMARAFAAKRGWTVEHVYVDDGISGAEFKRRPGFQRLMAAATTTPPTFQKLIVSEQKSIGREMSETAMAIKQLAQAGVEIFEYVHGRSITPKNALDKILSSVQGYADEDHRAKTAERVHEAFIKKVQAGHVVGGRVFGYRNVDKGSIVDAHGRERRTHVELEINEDEARVVGRIFELYDQGYGLKRIAKTLSSEGAPFPKPFERKASAWPPIGGWSPFTIRTILSRDIYHGEIVWNKSKKRDEWGQVKQVNTPESEWLRVPAEHLRIVPEALWQRVATRRQEYAGQQVRFSSGRLCGVPPKHGVNNMLSGLGTCALCGGGIIVETSHRKGKPRVPEYICSRRRLNSTCTNRLHIPVEDLNEAILSAIEEHILTPEAIEQFIQFTERDDLSDTQAKLDKELADVDRRIQKLTTLVETASDVDALVARLRDLEARRRSISAERKAVRPVPRLPAPVIESLLSDWRRNLRGSATQARAVLQRLFKGRLRLTPVGDSYRFEAETRFDRLFAGLSLPKAPAHVAKDGRGTGHIGAEDTFDGDYGRLLEAAHARANKAKSTGKKTNAEGMASPHGPARVWTREFRGKVHDRNRAA